MMMAFNIILIKNMFSAATLIEWIGDKTGKLGTGFSGRHANLPAGLSP